MLNMMVFTSGFWDMTFEELEPHQQVGFICGSILLIIAPFVIISVVSFNKSLTKEKHRKEIAMYLLEKYGSWNAVIEASKKSAKESD